MTGRSLADVARFLCRVSFEDDGCWRWIGGFMPNGYGTFRMGGRTITAHRAAFLIARGRLPEGERPSDRCVLHSCDRPWCVNPDHLRAGTQRENIGDMIERGRKAPTSGSVHGSAKLTEADVIEMRRMREAGAMHKEIAARFGVSEVTSCVVCSRKAWGHVA